ncbi:MAG: sensor histidine kinase [Halobacteriota archaeon]|uniref:sensor histidine kinase n=1 Tax=Natronomonas sp. TaxID=2184060 RepID=UPI003975DC7E
MPNRLIRHNLRHEAQYLLGVESQIADAETPEVRKELTERIRTIANRLSETHDTLRRSQELIRSGDRSTGPLDLREAVEDVVREYRSMYPDAAITVEVPEAYRVSAGSEFRTVLEELLENAIVCADGEPDVWVSGAKSGRRIKLEVTDNCPGIPEPDRSVVTRKVETDQMPHAQGLGLWFVRWAIDPYGRVFGLDTGDDGTTVRLELASS